MAEVMQKEALEFLISTGKTLAVPVEREYDGRKYINKELKAVDHPTVTPLRISTLSSLIDLCIGKFAGPSTEDEDYGFERFDAKRHIIHVVNEKQVQVVTAISNAWKDREILVDCVATPTEEFIFGKFMSQDQFIIALLSKFTAAGDRDELAGFAGKATDEQIATLIDDGISQTVSMKAGSTLQDQAIAKKFVELSPFRTFREVDQPKSKFLFRLQKPLQFALFEADGGHWRIHAVEAIARRLSGGVTEATVVS